MEDLWFAQPGQYAWNADRFPGASNLVASDSKQGRDSFTQLGKAANSVMILMMMKRMVTLILE